MGTYRIKSLKLLMVATLVMIFAFIASAPQANAAEFWKAKFVHFSATAGETVATGDVVCLDSYTGYAYKADQDLGSRNIPVGVIGKGGASGAVVEIVVSGILAGQTKGSPGSRLYLSATAGALTTTATDPGYILGYILPNVEDSIISESTNYFISVPPPAAASQL